MKTANKVRFEVSRSKFKTAAKLSGFVCLGEYQGATSPVLVRCKAGHETKMSPTSIKRGSNCSKCAHTSVQAARLLFISTAKRKGFVNVGQYVNANTKVKMTCSKGHACSIAPTAIKSNDHRGCSECKFEAINEANNEKSKKSGVKFSELVKKSGYTLNSEYSSSARKVSMTCDKGHNLSMRPANFQTGHRCAACMGTTKKEAYIKLVVNKSGVELAVKFGIANSAKARSETLNRFNKSTQVITVAVWAFESDLMCKEAELECKRRLKCSVISRVIMPDGYTETTDINNTGTIGDIYESFGGVKV